MLIHNQQQMNPNSNPLNGSEAPDHVAVIYGGGKPDPKSQQGYRMVSKNNERYGMSIPNEMVEQDPSSVTQRYPKQAPPSNNEDAGSNQFKEGIKKQISVAGSSTNEIQVQQHKQKQEGQSNNVIPTMHPHTRHQSTAGLPKEQLQGNQYVLPYSYYTYHGETAYPQMPIPQQWAQQFYRYPPNAFTQLTPHHPNPNLALHNPELTGEYYPLPVGGEAVLASEGYTGPMVSHPVQRPHKLVLNAPPMMLKKNQNHARHSIPHTHMTQYMPLVHPSGSHTVGYPSERTLTNNHHQAARENPDEWESMSTSSELSLTNRLPP